MADTRDHGDLADFLADRHCSGQNIRRGFVAAHNFKQLHDIGWREEMHANHILRTRCACGDFVDIKIGCIRRQYRTRFADGVQLAKYLFLDVHALVDRFDNQIAVGQIIQRQRWCQQGHHAFHLLLREASLGSAVFIIFADNANTAVQIFLHHFDNGYGDALGQEVHRNAAAHGAGTNDADFLDVAQWNVFRKPVDFRCLPFGKEHMALCR